MAKIDKDTVSRWRIKCAAWLAARPIQKLSLGDVKTGSDAWLVAHQTGIAKEAYDMDRNITDAHIKTALQSIFPNAVFKDKYYY